MKRIFTLLTILTLSLRLVAQEGLTEDQLYFTVTPSKTHVYEQEAVLLTYTFHVYGSMGLSVGMNSKPDFEGLVSQEIALPQNKTIYTENVRGRLQRAGVVKQSLVFPQRAGRIVIPGLTFNCEVHVGEGALGAKMNVKRRVPDVVLQVEALPTPVPRSFHGAVGQFDANAALSHTTCKTGDAVTRLLTIKGQGNLRLITPPQLFLPEGVDQFDPTVDDGVKVTTQGMQGTVTFNYSFMPRNVGEIVLPADTFTYFDPQLRAYRDILLAPQTIHVAKGTRSDADVQQEAELRRSDIRPDHTEDVASWPLGWGIGLWLLGICAVVGCTFFAHHRLLRRAARREEQRRVKGAMLRAQKGLEDARRLLRGNDTPSALAQLDATLMHYVSERLIDQTSTSRTEMVHLLIAQGFEEQLVNQWQALLKEIDALRFGLTQTSTEECASLIERAATILSQLEQQA